MSAAQGGRPKAEVAGVPPTPLVAIVTPVFNGGCHLAQTMESVQAQDYPNIVHCVLDNGSTDDTAHVISRFSHGRVPLLTTRNETTIPVIENWNAALRLVPTEASYFRILSADDTIDPTYVSKLVAFGEQHSDVNVIACQERRGPYLVGTRVPSDDVVFDGRTVVRRCLLKEMEFPCDHCLYKRSATGLSAEHFEYQYYGVKLLCTDTDATIRLLCEGSCGIVKEPLATTRWPGTVTSAEMLPNQVGIWSMLQIIDRWGPHVFDTKAEYLAVRNAHLRSYLLHLLFWRLQGRRELVEKHLDWLNRAAVTPTLLFYLQSVLESPFLLANGWLRRKRLPRLA
jgi:glycosyltransferase involved in cell wall biosynthesis